MTAPELSILLFGGMLFLGALCISACHLSLKIATKERNESE